MYIHFNMYMQGLMGPLRSGSVSALDADTDMKIHSRAYIDTILNIRPVCADTDSQISFRYWLDTDTHTNVWPSTSMLLLLKFSLVLSTYPFLYYYFSTVHFVLLDA